MAWRSHGRTNAELISNLFSSQLIKSSQVKEAMLAVDRAHYCLNTSQAYQDSPQSIGHSATISAPHMHALAAEALMPFLTSKITRSTTLNNNENKSVDHEEEKRVLDIGSGSGYLTHVLANIVFGSDYEHGSSQQPQTSVETSNRKGKVIGIDHIKPLVEMAEENMNKSLSGQHLLSTGKVQFILGDGRKGYEEGGPYDVIHVGAAASELHETLIDQLKSPGRLFIPVEDQGDDSSDGERGGAMRGLFSRQQWIWIVDKDADGKVTRKKDIGVRYVPLTNAPVPIT